VKCHDCPVTYFYRECEPSTVTLDECPVGSVINILSATAEVRRTWWRQRWQCSRWASSSCTRSIINHSAIVSCNGQQTCSFSSYVLDYPPDDKLCEDENFVSIEYKCITSKKRETLLIKMFDNS